MSTQNTVMISSPVHVAHLDYRNGVGLLVFPNPATDVVGPMIRSWHPTIGTVFIDGSVHAQSLSDMTKNLARLGWQVCLDELDELPLVDGYLPNGRAVVGLVGPSDVDASLEDIEKGYQGLRAKLGGLGQVDRVAA